MFSVGSNRNEVLGRLLASVYPVSEVDADLNYPEILSEMLPEFPEGSDLVEIVDSDSNDSGFNPTLFRFESWMCDVDGEYASLFTAKFGAWSVKAVVVGGYYATLWVDRGEFLEVMAALEAIRLPE